MGGLMLVGRSPTFRRWAASLRSWFPESSAKLTIKSRGWPRALRYLILRTDPRRVLGRVTIVASRFQPRARGWALR